MSKINTNLHLSDEASSIFINKEGTVWKDNSDIETLQDALDTLQPSTVKNVIATDEIYGTVRLAKDNDIENGVGTNDVVTSEQMLTFNRKPHATYDDYGTTIYASESEVNAGKVNTKSITPKELQSKWTKTKSTETIQGTIKLSQESMVVAGTDHTTAMTPKLVKMAINRLVPSVAIATEDNTGTVTLANIATTGAGVIREGYAITPYSFVNTNANTSNFGTVRLATVAETKNPTINAKLAITPEGFNKVNATEKQYGTTRLATEQEVKSKVNDNIAVSPKSIGFIVDTINQLIGDVSGIDKIGGFVPIGAVVESFIIPDISSGFVQLNGEKYNKNTYPEAFKLLGYTYGGSGDWFNVPDLRGLYTRSVGKGKHITGTLSDGVDGGNVGVVQRQQVRRHKHISPFAENRVSDAKFGRIERYGQVGVSAKQDWDNYHLFTSDGEPWGGGNPNPDGIIGSETRPWTMSVYKLMRIK